MKEIQMVDLTGQLDPIRKEVDQAMDAVLKSARFIKGPQVNEFEENLSQYLDVAHVISCGNGTDALQIALMALDLNPGDEVIVPAFTYAATAEVVALLGLELVMIDVDANTFNLNIDQFRDAINPKTRVIIPVHLFGLTSRMHEIMLLADAHDLYVIEDNAQAIGSEYTFPEGHSRKAGTIGQIGSTSFFPTKNLGCFGDGGALCTSDPILASRMRIISTHGQRKKYHHEVLGVNSRLDTIQAAILDVKLKYLDDYIASRQKAAGRYDAALRDCPGISIPGRTPYSTHVFHQYTIQVKDGRRDGLRNYLKSHGIPSMIYYPVPLYRQNAYKQWWMNGKVLPVTERLCQEVLSLPMHTELTNDQIDYICEKMMGFFKKQ